MVLGGMKAAFVSSPSPGNWRAWRLDSADVDYRITEVARQHDTGRPQGDKNSGGLNPAPGEHTR